MIFRKSSLFLFCVLILSLATASQANLILQQRNRILIPGDASVVAIGSWKYIKADSSVFADSSYSNVDWEDLTTESESSRRVVPGTGIWWYRTPVDVLPSNDSGVPLCLSLECIISAYEIYWDGRRIADNGKVGKSVATEQPGICGHYAVVPPEASGPGRHLLAIRVSNHSGPFSFILGSIKIGYLPRLMDVMEQTCIINYFFAGIFFMAGLFNLFFLIGKTKPLSNLLFAGLCFAFAVNIVFFNLAIWQLHISTSRFFEMEAATNAICSLMILLLPTFFLFEFGVPGRKVLLIIIIILFIPPALIVPMIFIGLLSTQWIDYSSAIYGGQFMIVGLFSLAVSLWACIRKKPGGLTALFGVLLFLGGLAISIYISRIDSPLLYRFAWGIGFAGFIAILGISLSLRMAERGRSLEKSQLKATRLELELLKKHIHPHYLLNSLNSIIAWIEENPTNAVSLVSALADELRMLLRYAELPLIPLREEIALCTAHLRVMSLRYGKELQLATEGLMGNEMIPPLVFHTLVENGLTHGFKEKKAGYFVLKRSQITGGYQLELFNDGAVSFAPGREGGGTRYVKLRLEEAFSGKWSLKCGAVSGGWSSIVEIKV